MYVCYIYKYKYHIIYFQCLSTTFNSCLQRSIRDKLISVYELLKFFGNLERKENLDHI